MNQDTIKKMLVGLIIIIAIAIGVTLVISMLKKDDGVQQNTNEVVSPVTKKEVPSDKLPDKFPADIPVEKDAIISQNYNATATNGQFQATRAFETKKTLDENYALYTTWLKSNGWTIKSTLDEAAQKMVSGSKDKQELQVSIYQNSATQVKTVSLTFTQLP